MATRLYAPEQFSMTAGVNVPFDLALIEDLYDALPRRLGETRLTDLIDDRRFAETIYRVALADGIMDRVTYQDPPKTLPNRSGQTVVAQLAHEGLRRRAYALSGEVVTRFQSDSSRTDCRFESYHPSQAVGSLYARPERSAFGHHAI